MVPVAQEQTGSTDQLLMQHLYGVHSVLTFSLVCLILTQCCNSNFAIDYIIESVKTAWNTEIEQLS